MLGMINFKSALCKQHQDENLSYICTEQECESSRVICVECKIDKHKEHIAKPFKIAINEVFEDFEPRASVLTLSARIDQLFIKYRSALKQLKIHPEGLKLSLVNFFKQIRKEIDKHQQNRNSILQSKEINEELNQRLRFYKFYVKEGQNLLKSNYELLLEEIVSFLEMKLNELEFKINQKAEPHQILKVFQPFSTNKKLSYHFSSILKSDKIKLNDNFLTIQLQQNCYTTSLALIEPAIQNNWKLSGKKIIRFKSGKSTTSMSIGIAYKSIVKKNNFTLNTSDIGHGVVMLSFQGYSFHHSDTAMNSYYHNNMMLTEEQIITVTVDSSRQLIIFQKENGLTVEMAYVRIPNEQLYFCASLNNPIEILSILK